MRRRIFFREQIMDELPFPLDWEFPYLGEDGDLLPEPERAEDTRIVRSDRLSEALGA